MRPEISQKIQLADSDATSVDLSGLNIVDDELKEVFESLSPYKSLKELFLNHNQISFEGCDKMGQYILSLPNLSFLDLQFNAIDMEGARTVLNFRRFLPKLEVALHGNKITDEGEMDRLVESLTDEAKHS